VTDGEVEVYRDALADLHQRSLSAELSRTVIAEREEALRSAAAW